MNVAIDRTHVSQNARGILGETLLPTLDANGNMIMHGMDAIRGEQEDCECSGMRVRRLSPSVRCLC